MADQPPSAKDDPGRLALISYVRLENHLPCPGCRYNIGGLPGLVCPECGREYRMSDVGVRPRPAWVNFLRSGWGALLLVAFSALVMGSVSVLKPPAAETARVLFYGTRWGNPAVVAVFGFVFLLVWFRQRISRVPQSRARAGDTLLVVWGLMAAEVAGVLATWWI